MHYGPKTAQIFPSESCAIVYWEQQNWGMMLRGLEMMSTVMSKILSFLSFGGVASNAGADYRRQHIRHAGVQAEVIVGSRAYSIRDWSMGGVAFETAPDARLTAGDKVQITLKFRLPHDTITIQQTALIVRTAKRGIAAKFAALPKDARRQFERVLDSLHAQSFLESQVA